MYAYFHKAFRTLLALEGAATAASFEAILCTSIDHTENMLKFQ